MSGSHAQRYLRLPLLAFALMSIGFAWGRLSAPQVVAAAAVEAEPQMEKPRVLVRYFHGAIRCMTCNQIEATLQRVLQQHYPAALADGRIAYDVVNVDVYPELAKRYDISSSVPVISYQIDGKEAGVETLMAVWDRLDDQQAMEALMLDAIERAATAAGLNDLQSGGA